MMRINVGSLNPKKIEAVMEKLQEYDCLHPLELCALPVDSGVPDQPITLEQTVVGAANRAFNAFFECDVSIGLESGLVPVSKTRTGYVGVLCCIIYTGKENDFYFGQSSGFEYPSDVIKLVIEKSIELDVAFKDLGYTESPRIGYSNGIIGYLTQDKITRKDLAKEAVRMALVSFLNKDLYKKL